MLTARRNDALTASNVTHLRRPQAANDNALTDRASQQVDSIGLAFIALLGMFGVFLLCV